MNQHSLLKRPRPMIAARCWIIFSSICLAVEAQSAISLGNASSFAILGGSTVTDAGVSDITGNIGVSPGTAITGIDPNAQNGGILHLNDSLAIAAHTDALASYGELAGMDPDTILTGLDLGGMVLTPGTYVFSSSAFLTGTLTLDGLGQAEPQFIIQIGSTLVTSSDSAIIGINGAGAMDVFFQVGSSATLGTNSHFEGTIIADQSITMNTGSTLTGRLLAINGAVVLDGNTVTNVPETGICGLIAFAFAGLSRRKRLR